MLEMSIHCPFCSTADLLSPLETTILRRLGHRRKKYTFLKTVCLNISQFDKQTNTESFCLQKHIFLKTICLSISQFDWLFLSVMLSTLNYRKEHLLASIATNSVVHYFGLFEDSVRKCLCM